MSINHAVLGLLSIKPFSGYDLKKLIQDSFFMPWSGNNNQIYKALVELHDEGLVSKTVQHQESSPSKKIYAITAKGSAELKKWMLAVPDAPEFKKIFLIQLAWADQLDQEEIETMLSQYEKEIKIQILIRQEKKVRGSFSPDRTERETYLWDMIHDNLVSSLNYELYWIKKLRQGLRRFDKEDNNHELSSS
ncbi:MAG: PadR family transcriptional regulator [Syntrophomonadaceae bacterium]|nr:PadR family transcriptional regulator [Syntrophomonadaceae bacterium]